MKIKINDKIFQLKYVESDENGSSLMELVEEKQKFKKGDFVYVQPNILCIADRVEENTIFSKISVCDGNRTIYINNIWELSINSRIMTKSEISEFKDILAERGKRWNAEKLYVEDIIHRKFKKGDKVRIKREHSNDIPIFDVYLSAEHRSKYINKTLTVVGYRTNNLVIIEESCCHFSEEWLELADEPKAGELVIAWDEVRKEVIEELKESMEMIVNIMFADIV